MKSLEINETSGIRLKCRDFEVHIPILGVGDRLMLPSYLPELANTPTPIILNI